jgi:hypothetical protein
MLWSLDQDDYTGLFCAQGQFPFTRRVYDVIHSSSNHSNEQELFSSTKETELYSVELYTTQRPMPTSTRLPSDSRIVNRSVKNIGSFYLLFIVLLSV